MKSQKIKHSIMDRILTIAASHYLPFLLSVLSVLRKETQPEFLWPSWQRLDFPMYSQAKPNKIK